MAANLAAPPPPSHLPPSEVTRRELTSQQVKIQIALLVSFVFYIVILILGRFRSKGRPWMKNLSTYSFMITANIVNYIPGLMSAPGESNDLYIFWIAFMAYLAAITNEISCFTLGDNGERKKRLLVDYTVLWTLILTSLYHSLAAPEILVPIVLLFWVVFLKFRERRYALKFADNSSNGFSQGSKIVADFTDYQKKLQKRIIISNDSAHNQEQNQESEDKLRKEHKVLVGVRDAQKLYNQHQLNYDLVTQKVITLDEILDSKDAFLKKLKKDCVSFAFFWTLLAKMGGYTRPPAQVDVKLFEYDGKEQLLVPSFEIVERELEFLYDYIFTNSYAVYRRGFGRKLRDLVVISLFLWLTIPLFVEYQSQDHNVLFVTIGHHVLDNGFTRCVILAILIIEYTQIGLFLTSRWAKVMYACTYLQNEKPGRKSIFLKYVLNFACHIPRPKRSFWTKAVTKRKVGQYSIRKSYGAIPLPVWAKCWIGDYFDLPRFGQAQEKYTTLKVNHKDWFLKAIKDSFVVRQGEPPREAGSFTNGIRSLQTHRVHHKIIEKYASDTEAQARIILIWHMATSHLEEERAKNPPPTNNDKEEFEMAILISKYCAYLVAFVPQVLPDHVYTTQCEFDEVIRELKEEHRIKYAVHYEDDPDEEKQVPLVSGSIDKKKDIKGRAKKLVKKLEGEPDLDLWKTLADFWTEKLLYMALGDHDGAVEAHANGLCTGGQFITHLWALLTHAGCSRIK